LRRKIGRWPHGKRQIYLEVFSTQRAGVCTQQKQIEKAKMMTEYTMASEMRKTMIWYTWGSMRSKTAMMMTMKSNP
jgi:hypothetical protein